MHKIKLKREILYRNNNPNNKNRNQYSDDEDEKNHYFDCLVEKKDTKNA